MARLIGNVGQDSAVGRRQSRPSVPENRSPPLLRSETGPPVWASQLRVYEFSHRYEREREHCKQPAQRPSTSTSTAGSGWAAQLPAVWRSQWQVDPFLFTPRGRFARWQVTTAATLRCAEVGDKHLAANECATKTITAPQSGRPNLAAHLRSCQSPRAKPAGAFSCALCYRRR
jgi:hypothetical protein